MEALLLQIAVGFFGVILLIITGLMAYMTKAVINASNKIAILEATVSGTQNILETISEELRDLARHDSLIAVLNSEVGNLKADTSLLFEKLRELERHDRSSIRRRQ